MSELFVWSSLGAQQMRADDGIRSSVEEYTAEELKKT